MVVWVVLNWWAGIPKWCMTRRGMMLNADPGSTWMHLLQMIQYTLWSTRADHVFPWPAYHLMWRWCRGHFRRHGGNPLHLLPVVQPEFGPWRPQHQLGLPLELLLLTLIVSGARKGWSWLEYWLIEPGRQSGRVLWILPHCPLGEP